MNNGYSYQVFDELLSKLDVFYEVFEDNKNIHHLIV